MDPHITVLTGTYYLRFCCSLKKKKLLPTLSPFISNFNSIIIITHKLMTGRVLQLAFLYTTASLLQGGKSQLIPSHHNVHGTSNISYGGTVGIFDHHNGIDTSVPSIALTDTRVPQDNSASTHHSGSIDVQSSIPENTTSDSTESISSTGTVEDFGDHGYEDPGGLDGPYIEDDGHTSDLDGPSGSSLLTDSSSSTASVGPPSILHPTMSTLLTISVVPSDYPLSSDELSTEDDSHTVDSGGVTTTGEPTEEPTGSSESTESTATPSTSETSSLSEDSTTSILSPSLSTSLEDATTSESDIEHSSEPTVGDMSDHTSDHTSEHTTEYTSEHTSVHTSGSIVESTSTTSSGLEEDSSSEAQTSHDEHTHIVPTTASYTPEVTSSSGVEEHTWPHVQHDPSTESTDVASGEPSHQPWSDTDVDTGTPYNSTSTEHHPATLSESTTTTSSEILSSGGDRASSNSDVSSMQTYSSERSSGSSVSSTSLTSSTSSVPPMSFTSSTPSLSSISFTSSTSSVSSISLTSSTSSVSFTSFASSGSSRTLVPYAVFSAPRSDSRTGMTSETSSQGSSETTSEKASKVSLQTSSETTSEVSEQQFSVTPDTGSFIRGTSETSTDSFSNDAVESSIGDYRHSGDYGTTSEDVGTPTSHRVSYITQYQYVTATEIITLVPSSVSVSRVVVTMSPVLTETLRSSSSKSNTVSSLGISIISSEPMYGGELLITEVLQGATVVLNHFTTVTLFSTSTVIPNSKARSEETARKNRRVGLGCGLGIGIPVLLAVVFTIYFVFIRSRKVDTIDPEGKIVTSYKMNKLKRAWYMLLGRELPGYGADAPVVDLGDEESELSDGMVYGQQGESVNRSGSGSGSSNWGGNAFNEKIEEPGAGVATGAAPVDSVAVPTAPAVAAAAAVPGPDTGYDGTRSGVDNVAGVIDDTSTMSSESFIGVSPLEGNPGYAGGFLYEDIPQDYYNYNHVSVNDASIERRDTNGYLSNRSRVSGTGSSGVGSGSHTGSSGGSNRVNQGTRDNIFSNSHAY